MAIKAKVKLTPEAIEKLNRLTNDVRFNRYADSILKPMIERRVSAMRMEYYADNYLRRSIRLAKNN
jgi:hypothetical protein